MMSVVRRTGHSSFYVEKALNALGKPAKELGLDSDAKVVGGGEWPGCRWRDGWLIAYTAFPIWLDVGGGQNLRVA